MTKYEVKLTKGSLNTRAGWGYTKEQAEAVAQQHNETGYWEKVEVKEYEVTRPWYSAPY